jgi:hypothetical protein
MKIETVKLLPSGWLVNGNMGVPDDPHNRNQQDVLDWIEAGGVVAPAYIYEQTYKENREQEYPYIGDQLDVLWRQFNQLRLEGQPLIQEADDMLGAILAIKAKYPKV